jgi:hypothetical protein
MKKYIVLLGVSSLLIMGGLFAWWLIQKDSDPDQQKLDQVMKAGSDLTKPHNIKFFLYFPTEEAANRAAEDLRKEGFNIKVEVGADKSSAVCFATKEMIPTYSELVKLRKRFNEITRKLNGEYTGWGTEIVK